MSGDVAPVCDNWDGPRGAGNTTEGLTRHFDHDEGGPTFMVDPETLPVIPPAPDSPCPTCGSRYLNATVTFENRRRTIASAYYLCPREHGWNLRWAVPS